MKERELDFYSVIEGKKQVLKELSHFLESGYTLEKALELLNKMYPSD
ncbi:hypothetical protein [Bacillus toyonensis]|nr:hypothetical protein [Bacillus toyonensis]